MSVSSPRQQLKAFEAKVVDELKATVDYGHVHTDVVRRLAYQLEGQRYGSSLLADERLLDAKDEKSWRAALPIIRIATQTAGVIAPDGFADGLQDVHTCLARLLEGKPPIDQEPGA